MAPKHDSKKTLLSMVHSNLHYIIFFFILLAFAYLICSVYILQNEADQPDTDTTTSPEPNIDVTPTEVEQLEDGPSKFCYKPNSKTIVFLHLTNETNKWIQLEMCVFMSAAKVNPDYNVCILSMSPMVREPKLSSLPNVDIQLLDVEQILKNSPAYDWYISYVLNDPREKPYITYELSDVLRYAYLFKYGGIYMDTDVLTLKKFKFLHNAIAWESEGGWNSVNNAVLFFEKGHPFLEAALYNVENRFKYGEWGTLGPRLLTYLHFSGMVDAATYDVLPMSAFYPISIFQISMHFTPELLEATKEVTKNAYVMHLWRSDNDMYWKDEPIPEGSFMHEATKTVCA